MNRVFFFYFPVQMTYRFVFVDIMISLIKHGTLHNKQTTALFPFDLSKTLVSAKQVWTCLAYNLTSFPYTRYWHIRKHRQFIIKSNKSQLDASFHLFFSHNWMRMDWLNSAPENGGNFHILGGNKYSFRVLHTLWHNCLQSRICSRCL